MPGAPNTAPNEVLAGLVDRVTFHNSDSGFCPATGAVAAGMTMLAGKSPKALVETAPPAEIRALLNLLLADPKVQVPLAQQRATEAAAPAPAKPKDHGPAARHCQLSRFAALCDKLVDIGSELEVVPGAALASSKSLKRVV
jgi:hypothetical protein